MRMHFCLQLMLTAELAALAQDVLPQVTCTSQTMKLSFEQPELHQEVLSMHRVEHLMPGLWRRKTACDLDGQGRTSPKFL